MNSSYFNSLFQSVIGTYNSTNNSASILQYQITEEGNNLLNYMDFNYFTLANIDIPFVCALTTFVILFYFFCSILRVVLSR